MRERERAAFLSFIEYSNLNRPLYILFEKGAKGKRDNQAATFFAFNLNKPILTGLSTTVRNNE